MRRRNRGSALGFRHRRRHRAGGRGARHHADRVRRREGRQCRRLDPGLRRWFEIGAGLHVRRGSLRRSVQGRKAAVLGRRQQCSAVRRRADRKHPGADQEVPGLPDRRLSVAPHHVLPAVAARQHQEKCHHGEAGRCGQGRQPVRRGGRRPAVRGHPVPDPEGRLRSDVEPQDGVRPRGRTPAQPGLPDRRVGQPHGAAGSGRVFRLSVGRQGSGNPQKDLRRDLRFFLAAGGAAVFRRHRVPELVPADRRR